MSASPAPSSRTYVKMKSLNFPSMGKMTEACKPQLGFLKDTLEIRWDVEGKTTRLVLPRSNFKLRKETIDEPSLLEVFFSPKNHLKRYILEQSQSDGTRKLLTMIAIPETISSLSTPPWYEWAKGIEYVNCEPRITPATRARHFAEQRLICEQMTALDVGQLRKSACITMTPAGSRSSPAKRTSTESPSADGKKVTEHLDASGEGDDEDEDELDEDDDTQAGKEPGTPIVETNDDPTLAQDVDKYLSGWADLSRRIQLRLSKLAQQEQDAGKKLAMLKHKEDEIAARENSLRSRESIMKKAMQDLQKLNAK